MSTFFPRPEDVAHHFQVWFDGRPRPLHYLRKPDDWWIAVEQYGVPYPRSDPFPGDELITILSDVIPHEKNPRSRRAAQAQSAARDFARALNEMLNSENPDWQRLASDALARHPAYSV